MNYLHVDSITKSFKTKIILNNLFISCKTGDIIGLLGRNGSGKSTLLKVIFGIEKANFKFQKVNDIIIQKQSKTYRWINYLPQDNFLPNNYKIKTLINFFCDQENITDLYQNNFIKPFLNSKTQELSGGEKRIIEILMILNTKSKFVLLDEPFNGVSPISIEGIKEMIQKKAKSKGIILTDHDYENVINISTNVKLLHNSSLFDIKNKEQLKKFGYIS
ncbi:ABC-type multidrug transport system, ATPase component [Tenacibaculum sp. MAR_2010_89]|uniref:ATP-binding cassette domain-containing protein n=1 Tax=Tenacibaculum sp. MAR_2010_89 TaxID=1250198 RepID=UPI000896F0AB|nr:ATP-binding cassette domain-containing protein [Tenacibaculum sp. MAR_2010_89]SEE06420.1 ABC-type multidrug transport system, ATPase component [Tenacibaculum sp. MAR_2010_89]